MPGQKELWTKVFLDWFLLGEADELITTASSSFGATAALRTSREPLMLCGVHPPHFERKIWANVWGGAAPIEDCDGLSSGMSRDTGVGDVINDGDGIIGSKEDMELEGDELKHDELKHDELKHDELKHDELKHDELKHDELKHDELKDDAKKKEKKVKNAWSSWLWGKQESGGQASAESGLKEKPKAVVTPHGGGLPCNGPVCDNPFTNCDSTRCTFDGCKAEDVLSMVSKFKKVTDIIPNNVARAGIIRFNDCVKEFTECTPDEASDEAHKCGKYPRCHVMEGFFCLNAHQSLGARVLYCTGKHLVMSSGHAFDYEGKTGGMFVPIIAGMKENQELQSKSILPFYAVAGSDETKCDVFEQNLLGENYLLLKTHTCKNKGDFDWHRYVNAMKGHLEMLTLDPDGEGDPPWAHVTRVEDSFPLLEDLEGPLRIVCMWLDTYDTRNEERMERYFQMRLWTKIYVGEPMYAWSEVKRKNAKIVIYIKGWFPEESVTKFVPNCLHDGQGCVSDFGCSEESRVWESSKAISEIPHPPKLHHQDAELAVSSFMRCAAAVKDCSEESVKNKESLCSDFSTCRSRTGYACKNSDSSRAHRVLKCLGEHLVATSGLVFDPSAKDGGMAVPIIAGMKLNKALERKSMTMSDRYLYTAAEASAAHNDALLSNLFKADYDLLRTYKCPNGGFDMYKFVNAITSKLEMFIINPNSEVDNQSDGKCDKPACRIVEDEAGHDYNWVSLVCQYEKDFPLIEDPNSPLRIVVVHDNYQGDNRIIERMQRLVAASRWTKVWGDNIWYEWSPIRAQQPQTSLHIYVKGGFSLDGGVENFPAEASQSHSQREIPQEPHKKVSNEEKKKPRRVKPNRAKFGAFRV